MKISAGHIGTCVSWTIAGGDTTTVRITGVDRDGISYVCTDGYHEMASTSFAHNLDDLSARWRPATPEETAHFERLYRPGPDQWN